MYLHEILADPRSKISDTQIIRKLHPLCKFYTTLHDGVLPRFTPHDIRADDWEFVEKEVKITRDQLKEAFVASLRPGTPFNAEIIFCSVAEWLGL